MIDIEFVLWIMTLLTALVVGINFYLLAKGTDDDE